MRCDHKRRCAASLLLGMTLALACGRPPDMLHSPEPGPEGVTFRFRAAGAQTVQLAGSWMSNARLRGLDWDAGTRIGLMQRSENDASVWELTVPLGTGRYEYLFLVNGRFWELDPANPQRVEDLDGGWVSLLVLR